LSSGEPDVVVPTRVGKDLESEDGKKDAHIRIETYKQVGTNIFVDVFDSAIEDANKAHLISQAFQWNNEGGDEATRFLQKQGFRVVVLIK
jgi:hypothetical protein